MSNQLSFAVDGQPEVLRLAEKLGAEWPSIMAARRQADETVAEIDRHVRPLIPADTSLVVFGSLARGEFTSGSDVDWTLLIDGQASPDHQMYANRIRGRLKEMGLEAPNADGPFGSLTFSHDLIHHIGGDDDTNQNTTQRLLLLLESLPIGDLGAYDRTIEHILTRYVEEDLIGPGDTAYRVPRFLQNDVVRYWRTMAVDFAHKRRVRGAKGWALRTAKLRMSRKLMYVAGLLSCYSCEFALAPEKSTQPFTGQHRVLRHLSGLVRTKPLDIVALVVLQYFGVFSGAARDLFSAYDEFLALLDDPERRRRLKELSPAHAETDEVYQAVREMGARFQGALTRMFFDSETPLPTLTRKYGVF